MKGGGGREVCSVLWAVLQDCYYSVFGGLSLRVATTQERITVAGLCIIQLNEDVLPVWHLQMSVLLVLWYSLCGVWAWWMLIGYCCDSCLHCPPTDGIHITIVLKTLQQHAG